MSPSPLKLIPNACLLAVAGMMLSCASLPEPSTTVQSLLVGQIVFVAKNFETMQGGAISVNGTSTDGLNLFLTNDQTKTTTKLHASDEGYFLTAALPPGNYFVSDILLDRKIISSGGVSADFQISINPSATTKFVMAPGTVTNLGKIVWTADAKTNSDVVPREDFSAVKAQFQTTHLKSAWLAQKWVSVTLTRHLDFDVDPSVPAAAPSPAGSPGDFKDASFDPVVRKVPPSVQALQKSDPDGFVKGLVVYLSKDSPNSFVTVKRFHDWVADNIAYDAPSFLSGRLPEQGYRAVLASRLAVCEGYATLFKKLCDVGGVPCALIDGYSRGYGSSVFASEDPTKSNHAWNLVQINKASYLIDTTWDSGYLENGHFTKSYSTGYLFADPTAFLHSHFPQNPPVPASGVPGERFGVHQAGQLEFLFLHGRNLECHKA